MKYRESVHSAAALPVTTTVPAEPLNPDTHSLPFQWSVTYSPLCGSVLGKTKAESFSLRISSRKRASLSVTFMLIIRKLLIRHYKDSDFKNKQQKININ